MLLTLHLTAQLVVAPREGCVDLNLLLTGLRRNEASRTPHGVRGLKFLCVAGGFQQVLSHPIRGAWIEISAIAQIVRCGSCRAPHGVRGLKFSGCCRFFRRKWSHPSRGAWIEIHSYDHVAQHVWVAPLTGCVD